MLIFYSLGLGTSVGTLLNPSLSSQPLRSTLPDRLLALVPVVHPDLAGAAKSALSLRRFDSDNSHGAGKAIGLE